MKELVHICCVLTGEWPGSSEAVRAVCPDLGAHYVRTLKEMVDRHAPPDQPYTFTCFTDRVSMKLDDQRLAVRPIPEGITTYFNKLYLFHSRCFSLGARVLFFDLDTVIVKSWGDLATVPLKVPAMLNDLWAEPRPASGVMSWRVSPETRRIWEDFEPMAQKRPPYSHPFPRRVHINADAIRTDEEWLLHYLVPHNWTAWQELLPGLFASYKFQIVRSMRGTGQQAPQMTATEARKLAVIYFHGLPRPHSIAAKWNPLFLSTTTPQPFTEEDTQ